MGYFFACHMAKACVYFKGKYSVCPYCFGSGTHTCFQSTEEDFIEHAVKAYRERDYDVLQGDLSIPFWAKLKGELDALDKLEGSITETKTTETKTSSNDANGQISKLFDKLDFSKASVHLGKECKEDGKEQYGPTYRIDVLTVDTDEGRIPLHIKVRGINYSFMPEWPKAYIVQVGKSKCNESIKWSKYNSILAAIAAKDAQNALETMQKITKTS